MTGHSVNDASECCHISIQDSYNIYVLNECGAKACKTINYVETTLYKSNCAINVECRSLYL